MSNFPDVIGQDAAKRLLEFHLSSYEIEGWLNPIIFTAPKGHGKTFLARQLAKKLKIPGTDTIKEFEEINCSTIKNVLQFFKMIVTKYGNPDGYYTIFFDEASELPFDVSQALLTVFEGGKDYVEFAMNDEKYAFNFKKTTWLFATSEPQSIFHALLNRFERIDLEDFTIGELADVIRKNISPEFSCEEDVIMDAAMSCRDNARNARNLGIKISRYLRVHSIKNLDKSIWNKMRKDLSIFPLGITNREIIVLKSLLTAGPCSLTKLATITGMTKESLQREVELFLLKNHFLEIHPSTGRMITEKGKEFYKLCIT